MFVIAHVLSFFCACQKVLRYNFHQGYNFIKSFQTIGHVFLFIALYFSFSYSTHFFLTYIYFKLFFLLQNTLCFCNSPNWASLVSVVRNSPGQCRRCKKHGFYPCVGKILWIKAKQSTPVFSPGESHGQKSLEVRGITESE